MALPAFVPYAKIAERLEADPAAHRALARVPWAVTEKIHGANLALVTDGTVVRAAKRKELLAEGDEFFGWSAIVERYAEAARKLADAAAAGGVIVYGEIFGGGYPHPDVAPVAGVEPVQTGVWYAPGIEWRAFDVAVVRDGEAELMDWAAAESLLAAAGLPYLRPLHVGKMNEAESYALGFATRVPAELGLPPIAGNRAEGIVIKPTRAVLVDGVSIAPRIKRKLAEFAEDERFSGAQKWGAAKRRGVDDAKSTLLAAVRARINEPRVHAARSKIGRVRRDDVERMRALETLIVDEVIDEVRAARPAEWQRLPELDRAALCAQAASDVSVLLRQMLP